MGQRNFNPRSPIPKNRLMSDLEEGLTLQEIADKYNRSRSFISECCSLHQINLDEIKGREQRSLTKILHGRLIEWIENRVSK